MSRPDAYSSPKDPLALELLVTQDERRSTDLPEARRDNMPELVHTFDAIDHEVAADPICDNISQRRSSSAAGNVLAILAQLEAERSER